jgi:effector-binding domain-containing protein
MNTKIKWSISAILIAFFGWYFLIKQSDYTITFEAKAATGTIFQGIQEWSVAQSKKNNGVYTTQEKKNFDFIKQEYKKGDNQMEYSWNIKSINDSTSKVEVNVKDMNHSWYNKLTVPFINTPFKQQQINKIKDFKAGLEEHLKAFKVKIDGEGQSSETFVAYITLKSVLQEKAQTMIGNDATITGYLHTNNIKIIGHPYVEITNWDRDKETLTFNYCFPVSKNATQVADPNVKFKVIPAMKGLKATYYGNFRTSDRAWFALLDYAKRNDIELENKVLENFLANPFNGGNELEWETKIIIPFASK